MLTAKPTVFVVDDDASVRAALQLLIESAGWRSEAFGSGGEFLARPPVPTPSCLVLDLMLPDCNGLDIQQLVADRADMPVIFISGQCDVRATVRAMKQGAFEFLPKPVDAALLIAAIENAIDRSRAQLEDLVETQRLHACFDSLSRREREVMMLVVRGHLNKQVGVELGISEITVKAHRGSMMRKMGAGSLPELVIMASRLRLMPERFDDAALARRAAVDECRASWTDTRSSRPGHDDARRAA